MGVAKKTQESSLSAVCEKVLDRCLAPSTITGEGCDNMTMILVQFKKPVNRNKMSDVAEQSTSSADETEIQWVHAFFVSLISPPIFLVALLHINQNALDQCCWGVNSSLTLAKVQPSGLRRAGKAKKCVVYISQLYVAPVQFLTERTSDNGVGCCDGGPPGYARTPSSIHRRAGRSFRSLPWLQTAAQSVYSVV